MSGTGKLAVVGIGVVGLLSTAIGLLLKLLGSEAQQSDPPPLLGDIIVDITVTSGDILTGVGFFIVLGAIAIAAVLEGSLGGTGR